MNPEDEVFKNFLVEMGEKLEELENGLAELEDGFSQDVVNKLFRAVHTIKGVAVFLDSPRYPSFLTCSKMF